MRVAFVICLALAAIVAVTAYGRSCKSGSYSDCSDLEYEYDYETDIYYCCEDTGYSPVLFGGCECRAENLCPY